MARRDPRSLRSVRQGLTGIRQLHELIAGHAEEPDQVVMASNRPWPACSARYKVTSTATCDRAEQWQPHPGVLFTGHRGPVFEEHLDLEANAHVVDRNVDDVGYESNIWLVRELDNHDNIRRIKTGIHGWRLTVYAATVARPDTASGATLVLRHRQHAGAGGWWTAHLPCGQSGEDSVGFLPTSTAGESVIGRRRYPAEDS
jgi:hypothetical protein